MESTIRKEAVELLANQDIFIGENFKKGKTVFLFPGHGSQYPNMLKGLYETNTTVKDIFDEADNILKDLYGETLTENIFFNNENEKNKVEVSLKKAKIMQTSIFTCNYALYKLTEEMNIKADYLCGHSLGEISALAAGGVISFAEGLNIVFHRAEALDMIPAEKRGGMISVSISKDNSLVEKLLDTPNEKCCLSLNNAPDQIVISGSTEAIKVVEKKCIENNLSYNVLAVSHAFHSHILNEAVEYYYNKIKNIKFKNQNTKIYSTIKERLYTEEDFLKNDFAHTLAEQLITPFSFCDIIKDMYETLDANNFIEIGCKNILTRLVKKILSGKEFYAIETNLKAKDDKLCIERFKNYMDVNNLMIGNTEDSFEIESAIKKIINFETGYPVSLINITKAPMNIDLAINKTVFDIIINKIKDKFNIDNNDLYRKDISLYEIVSMAGGTIEESAEVSTAKAVNVNVAEIEKDIKKIVAEKTGYPEEMLENDLDLEADLGIDSVKQGEIFAIVRDKFGYEMDENANVKEFNTIGKIIDYTKNKVGSGSSNEVATKTATVAIDVSAIEKDIKKIVAEKTGYPEEMLENDLDLEADLGIDSVKQGEIFAIVRDKFGYEMDENANVKEFNTIGKIIDYTKNKVGNEVKYEVAAEKEVEVAVDKADIEKGIKKIVAEKTGYPEEMLENNLDLEADLGIDSVKQGEIFAIVREHFGYEMEEGANIKEFNTIGKIIDYTSKAVINGAAVEEPQKKNKLNDLLSALSMDNVEDPITTRYMGVSVEKKYPENGEEFDFKNKNVLIVEDKLDKEITQELVKLIKAETSNICVIGTKNYDTSYFVSADFESIDSLKTTISKAVEELGRVDIVINLNGLRENLDFNTVDYDTWNNQVSEVYNVIFYTSKYAYKYFEENSKECAYFAATNIGGIFGVEREFLNNPIGAITSGYLKGLEKELRPFNCKVCDFTDINDSKEIANRLFKDYKVREELIEVGYCNNIRKTICVLPKEIESKEYMKPFELSNDDVVLVSGGGRGIILECVKGLAQLFNPKIIITGRTELPKGDEKWINFNDEEMEKYKPEFIRELINDKKVKTPFEAIGKYNKLLNARELYENISNIKAQGYNIQYVKCDACDDKDTDRLAKYIKENFGEVTGIVNGAGLPSFGRVTKKNEEFALRVVQVKADGFYNMYNKFKSDKLKFFVSMGSISGRFGMDGQVDYSAGADIIVKLTSLIKKDNPDLRCTVLGWTAWDEVGMASDPQVQKVQKEVRKLEYLRVKEGVNRFLNEIVFGCNYDEVLFFGNIGKENTPLGQLDYLDEDLESIVKFHGENGEVIDRTKFPLLETIDDYHKGEGIVCSKEISKVSDVHLRDHVVEGSSVFAGVMHIETACELMNMYQQLESGERKYHASEILNYNFDKFIKYFENNKLRLKINGKLLDKNEEKEVMKVTISSDFVNKKGMVLEKDRIHSYGDIVFTSSDEPVKKTDLNMEELIKQSKEIDMDKYYEKASGYITFGETFRCITYAGMVNEKQMVGKVTVPSDEVYFSYVGMVDSIISPVTIDNVGRFMLLNDYQKNGYTIVPRKITKAVKRRDFRINEEVYVNCMFLEENGSEVTYSAEVIGKDGEIIFEIEEMILIRINKENNDHNIIK